MEHMFIVGVMGGTAVNRDDWDTAYRMGRLIAENGWLLLNGGRDSGVMEASAKGAYEAGGLTLGILPGNNRSGVSQYIRIPVLTGMGSARNNINVLTSDVVIAFSGGAGTISEIALSLKAGKPTIVYDREVYAFFAKSIPGSRLHHGETPEQIIAVIRGVIDSA